MVDDPLVLSGGSKQDKAEKAVEQFTPASKADIDQFKQKVTEYLKATNKQELQPEKMKEDIQAMLKDPSRAKGILQNKASVVDRDTIVSILEQRSDISHEDAEKYASYAEKALDLVKSHLGLSSSGGDGKDEAYARTRVEHSPLGTVHIMESHAGSSLHQGGSSPNKASKAKERLQDFMNDLQNKKDFNINRIKQDFTNLFSSAGNDHESLTYKLKHYNEDEMMRFITNNTSIPPEKAHTIVAQAVEARDTVLAKADEVEREIKMRLDQAKEEALIQAENTRKAAASAAWWLVATAVVSGIASAVGGMLALDSWII